MTEKDNEKKYLNFEDALRERERIHVSKSAKNDTLKAIEEEEFKGKNIIEKLSEFLSDKGFRKFKTLNGEGNNALAFDTTESQIIKITYKSTKEFGKNIDSPYVLQPISVDEVGDIKVEIFPKKESLQTLVDNGELNSGDVYKIESNLKVRLKNEEIEMGDFNLDNISVMENGAGIIIDDGEVYLGNIKPKPGTKWVKEDGSYMQYDEFPNIKTGKIEGVYSKQDLPEGYSKSEAGQQVKEMIERKGNYRMDVAEELYERAEKEGLTGKLCEYVEKYKESKSKGKGEIER